MLLGRCVREVAAPAHGSPGVRRQPTTSCTHQRAMTSPVFLQPRSGHRSSQGRTDPVLPCSCLAPTLEGATANERATVEGPEGGLQCVAEVEEVAVVDTPVVQLVSQVL